MLPKLTVSIIKKRKSTSIIFMPSSRLLLQKWLFFHHPSRWLNKKMYDLQKVMNEKDFLIISAENCLSIITKTSKFAKILLSSAMCLMHFNSFKIYFEFFFDYHVCFFVFFISVWFTKSPHSTNWPILSWITINDCATWRYILKLWYCP